MYGRWLRPLDADLATVVYEIDAFWGRRQGRIHDRGRFIARADRDGATGLTGNGTESDQGHFQ